MVDAALRAAIAKANKSYGEGTLVFGKDMRHQQVQRLTTGSLALDEALGGGWPLNQWNELVGDESSGKTVVALQTVAANQRADKKWQTAWVAAEWLPPEWAELNGVDLDRMLMVNTNVMEEVYEIVVDLVRARSVDCVVIDSLPALIPETEDDQAMEDFAVGVGARLTGKFFRKQYGATKRSITDVDRPILALMINQWREKIGVMRGDPRTTPGGKGKNFAYFTRTECRRVDWLKEGDVRVGQKIAARVFKNKTAPGQRVAEFDFYFAEGGPVAPGQYDSLTEIINMARAKIPGLVKGRTYYVGGEKIATSAAEFDTVVRENESIREALVDAVLHGVDDEEAPIPTKPAKKKAVRKRG